MVSLPDLVASKKTQRDKDWPMVRRLVEVSYDADFTEPTPERIDFWLRELRSPDVLLEAVRRFPRESEQVSDQRAAVTSALAGDEEAVADRLAAEEARERELDRAYWAPLKAELERLRHRRPKSP